MSKTRTHRLGRLTRLARLFAVALMLFSCGCRALQPGVTVEHRSGEDPKTCPVPYSATYELLSVDGQGARMTHLEWMPLEREAKVGFVRHGDGSLLAYAGGRRMPIPEGHYVWQIAPETQRTRGELAKEDANRAWKATKKGLGYVAVGVLFVAGLGLVMLCGAGSGMSHD